MSDGRVRRTIIWAQSRFRSTIVPRSPYVRIANAHADNSAGEIAQQLEHGATPDELGYPGLSPEEVIAIWRADSFLACMEALTTPELTLVPAARRGSFLV